MSDRDIALSLANELRTKYVDAGARLQINVPELLRTDVEANIRREKKAVQTLRSQPSSSPSSSSSSASSSSRRNSPRKSALVRPAPAGGDGDGSGSGGGGGVGKECEDAKARIESLSIRDIFTSAERAVVELMKGNFYFKFLDSDMFRMFGEEHKRRRAQGIKESDSASGGCCVVS
jgi:hypothetical protein